MYTCIHIYIYVLLFLVDRHWYTGSHVRWAASELVELRLEVLVDLRPVLQVGSGSVYQCVETPLDGREGGGGVGVVVVGKRRSGANGRNT